MEISKEELQKRDEKNYLSGQRSAHQALLSLLLGELSYQYNNVDNAPENLMTIARLVKEREDTIAVLKIMCSLHGDNNWDKDNYIPDIIQKHLLSRKDE